MKKGILKQVMVCGGLAGLSGGLMAQEADPFASDQGQSEEKTAAKSIKVVYEVFSLPITPAAEIQRSGLPDREFYLKMISGLKEEKVKQEVFLTAHTYSGRRVEVSESREYIYATEFEPAELPNQISERLTKVGKDNEGFKAFPVTTATPTAFETRQLGDSFEAEVSIDADFIQLRIAPTRVSLIRKDITGQGVSKIEMPRFSNPRLSTRVVVRSGKPSYLGTVSAPAELQPEKEEQRVYFAFATATVISR